MRRQAVLSAMAVATSLLSQVLFFRMAAVELGLEVIGLYALIQTFFIFASVMQIGVGPNIVRRIALIDAGDADYSEWDLILGGLGTIWAPTFVLSAAAALIALFFSDFSYSSAFSSELLLVFILSGMLNAWFTCFALVLFSAVEGLKLLHVKSITIMIGAALGVAVGLWALSRWGAYALAVPALVASTIQAISSVLYLRWRLQGTRAATWQSATRMFRVLFREGLQLNGIALMRLMLEPLSKFLLAGLASLEYVAVFEILNRMMIAARSIVQGLLQPLLVMGSRKEDGLTEEMVELYVGANTMTMKLAINMFAAIAFGLPLLCLFVFDSLQMWQILCGLFLAAGSAVNLVGIPGYLAAMGGGQFGQMSRIHMVMLSVNGGIGIFLGFLAGGLGIIGAYALAFAYGGLACYRLLMLTLQKSALTGLAAPAILVAVATGFAIASPGLTNYAAPWIITSLGALCAAALFGISLKLTFGRLYR